MSSVMKVDGDRTVVEWRERKSFGSARALIGRVFARTALRSVVLVGIAVVRIIGCTRSAEPKNQTRSFTTAPPNVAPSECDDESEKEPSYALPLFGVRSIAPADARPYS